MTIPSRVLLYLICVVVAGALAACGGSSSVTGPEAAAPVLSAESADSKLTSSGEAQFRGVVESVGVDSLVVDGQTVHVVSGMTELLGRQNQPIPLSNFVVGSFVQVEGVPQPDGSVIATKVKLEDDDGNDDNDENDENEPSKVEFEATIQSLSPLTVGGTVVSTNGSTRILDDDNNPIPFSALAVGMRVEVEGWPQPDGSVLAKKIKIED